MRRECSKGGVLMNAQLSDLMAWLAAAAWLSCCLAVILR
jgi:hypothetical protein